MIEEKLQHDTIAALKAGDTQQTNTLRFALSQIKNKHIEKRAELSDDEVAGVLTKLIKQLQDSIEMFEKAGRQELVDDYKRQITIFQAYLPEELNDEELTEAVQKVLDENHALIETNPNALMGRAVGALKEQASPGRIVQTVKALLQIS